MLLWFAAPLASGFRPREMRRLVVIRHIENRYASGTPISLPWLRRTSLNYCRESTLCSATLWSPTLALSGHALSLANS